MGISGTAHNWQVFGDGGEARPSGTARRVADILAGAGITVNGRQPWDLHVRDERFFERVLALGNLGAGEAYMDGWWEVDALDEFFERVEKAGLERNFRDIWSVLVALKGRLANLQNLAWPSAWRNAITISATISIGECLAVICNIPAPTGAVRRPSTRRRRTSSI